LISNHDCHSALLDRHTFSPKKQTPYRAAAFLASDEDPAAMPLNTIADPGDSGDFGDLLGFRSPDHPITRDHGDHPILEGFQVFHSSSWGFLPRFAQDCWIASRLEPAYNPCSLAVFRVIQAEERC
jgi:hypothetical protein